MINTTETTNNKVNLKLNFTGFWPSFDKTDNFFFNLLAERYNITISDKPDILFYTEGGFDHKKYNCTKVFFTGENIRPDFTACDFAFTYDREITKKNYRLPLYALYYDVTHLVDRKIDAKKVLATKNKFCCFLVSNGASAIRNDFFAALSKYKHVDSGGMFLNNLGYVVKHKWDFIAEYKFVIAFENASHPGYTTEKIYEPFIKNCVPIYWGDPEVAKDFNPKAFINCHDYASFNEVIKRVTEVDNDDDLYLQYINQPVFTNNLVNDDVKKENIIKRLDDIVAYHFNGKIKVKAKVRPAYLFIKSVLKNSLSAGTYIKRVIKIVINV